MRPVASEECVRAPVAIVEASPEGGRRLASAYWREVERTTGGLVRVSRSPDGLALRALGATLLRFGLPRIEFANDRVSCCYPIEGGLLASRPGGSIVFTSSISGFHPRLAFSRGLYSNVQARLHTAVSRRYFARLLREGVT
jgi:hypothetical protein